MTNLRKYIAADNTAVIFTLDATGLVQESLERLDSWPPATKHLGQAMMAAALLQALNETDNSLSLQWNCDGAFGHLFAESRNFGQTRGTIQNSRPNVADYETGLGNGILQVRRGKGSLTTTSVVNSTGNVSLDIVEFLEKSEQRNCAINFSILIDWNQNKSAPQQFHVKSALGFLIHILPQNSEAKMNDILYHWDRHINALGPISTWNLGNDTNLDMARFLTGEKSPKEIMQQRVVFHCNCTEERAARTLSLLEGNEKFPPDGQSAFEIICEYCGEVYHIRAKEIK